MGEGPEILSSGGPGRARRWDRWFRWLGAEPGRPGPGGGRLGSVLAGAVALAAACLVAAGYLGLQLAHRDQTISGLRAALRTPRAAPPAAQTITVGPALPLYAGSAVLPFPDKYGGSFHAVVAEIRLQPGSGPVTWLFVYGQHAQPGERYGLLGGACADENITSYDWGQGTADWKGDLTIAAPNLFFNPRDPGIWLLVHRLGQGGSLGGIRGPLLGGGAKTFRSAPPC